MEVLIVGGGGREHALAWKIAQSPMVERLSVTHANPGFPASAERVQSDVVEFADRAGVDLVVVGPEAASPAFQDLVLIGSPARLGKSNLGTVALIAPTRIQYQEMIHAVRYIAQLSERILNVPTD